MQFRSLFVAPIPDAAEWFGDETWQMREFQTQVREGILRNPDAPESSIARDNGILPNSMWLNAAFYGVPEAIFFPRWPLVEIGRSVTFVLALFLLGYAYWFQRRRGVPGWLALASCLLLASTRSFFFASHSARFDLLVALGALLALDFLSTIYVRLASRKELTRPEHMGLILFPALCLLLNLHLTRIEFLPYLALLLMMAWRSYGNALAVGFGNLVVVLLLLLPAWLLVGHWSLFGSTPGRSQLVQTFGNLPIFHSVSLAVVRSTV